MRLFPIVLLMLAVAGLLSGGTYLGITAVQPPLPTASDVISVIVSGQLPSPCYPSPTGTVAVSGQNITVNLFSTAPSDAVCPQVLAPFSTTLNVGRLAAGTYTVTFRLNLDGRFTESVFQSFEVSQSCTYTLSSSGRVFQAGAATGSVSVTTSTGCGWTVAGFPGWVSAVNPASSIGSGTVTYQVSQNTGASRSGSLTIAGVSYTVEQAAPVNGLNVVGSLAHIASGGQWKTTITLVNQGTLPAPVRLNFFDDRGSPLALPLTFPQGAAAQAPVTTATVDRTINPGAVLVIESAGADATLVGWAQVLASGDVSGFAVLSAPQGAAGVPLENGSAASYLLYFDATDGAATGVALANTLARAVTVTATVRDDSGNTITSNTITIPAMGHTSFNMTDQYPGTAQKRGTLELKTAVSGQIVVFCLRFSPTGALSTIPVPGKP